MPGVTLVKLNSKASETAHQDIRITSGYSSKQKRSCVAEAFILHAQSGQNAKMVEIRVVNPAISMVCEWLP
jgi:hypothetical protein